jgi:RNA polymerase sigma-70 factor (ECF subfamily)
LEPDQRAVLVLRHLHDIDEHEVARMLDVPVGTVKSRTSRARDAFGRRWRP